MCIMSLSIAFAVVIKFDSHLLGLVRDKCIIFSVIIFCGFHSELFLTLGDWDSLCHFIVSFSRLSFSCTLYIRSPYSLGLKVRSLS